jgi:hypothetical protein
MCFAMPLLAHDFWIEPGSASLRVGEDFEGEPVRGSAPVLIVRRNGSAMLTYQSGTFAKHEMPREKFERYLAEEGLTYVHPSGELQRERFARFAKSAVRGAPEAIGALGWRFEIVALPANRFRVDYEGKPLRDVQVVAINRAKEHVIARTDADGVVSLDLAPGAWMIKSVHMVEAPKESGVTWESLWASLTLTR